MYQHPAKRLLDLVITIPALIALAPVFAIVALLVRLRLGAPVIFRQPRAGLGGQPFLLLKFRTMTDARDARGALLPDERRLTSLGRFLRSTSLDELPELVNVLRGEMSLVGPRPERPYFVEQLTQEIPYYAVRHSIKPGVTGWAQVKYQYGSTVEDSQEKLQYDLYYVKNHSLFLDFVILFETIGVVLTGKGAR